MKSSASAGHGEDSGASRLPRAVLAERLLDRGAAGILAEERFDVAPNENPGRGSADHRAASTTTASKAVTESAFVQSPARPGPPCTGSFTRMTSLPSNVTT